MKKSFLLVLPELKDPIIIMKLLKFQVIINN